MKNLEIKILNIYTNILCNILDNSKIYYNLKKLNEKYSLFVIKKDNIENIVDVLSNELMLNGLDTEAQEVNEYGKKIDDIIGYFVN